MLAFVLKSADDQQMGALLFQKCKDFKVYLPEEDHLVADYEGKITVAHGRLQDVAEELVCLLEPGAVPDKDFVRRVLRTSRRHPGFGVYHVNPVEGEAWPRKIKAAKLFSRHIQEGLSAPLSSFVFATATLKEKAVFLPDSSLDVLATVMACAADKPVRNVWRQTLAYPSVAPASGPSEEEKAVRKRLEFYRWSESFFGEDNYPISTGERLEMIAAELAKLYPSHTADELREEFKGFQAAQGPIRKVRAAGALKSALKARQQALQVQ